ncbi:helix-turn-helix domain-containing protein [Motilibacter aurantiacus]|uniref:helix-turn-helix domain-containing protein n=1 Tax=Motilibacter aurantiacus TaxID=2714955 RepID=UPI001408B5AB|nr:helix-turn-helix domain-containing protein [Motilibacter aurantiacus]NHC44528.1 helix-turn-helix domain-containing protein [Motilibacter aurantiacus]
MALLLDTDTIPGARARLDAFHDACAAADIPWYVVHEGQQDGLRSRVEHWQLGGVALLTESSGGISCRRTARELRRAPREVLVLSVQQGAEWAAETQGTTRTSLSSELFLKDLTTTSHYVRRGPGSAHFLLVDHARLGLPAEDVRRAVRRLESSPLLDLVRDHVAGLVPAARVVAPGPATAALAAATIELLRALVMTAADEAGAPRAYALAETLLPRLRLHITRNLRDPGLTPARIAAAHAVSLRQLYNVWARSGEPTLAQYILRERLAGARAELASPAGRGRTVAAVASGWGFGDATHFGRRFRQAYGVSPGEWRRQAAGS